MYIYMCLHIYIYVHTCIYVYMYIYTCIYKYIYKHIYISTCTCIYIHTYINKYVYKCIPMYMFTYIHTYLYTAPRNNVANAACLSSYYIACKRTPKCRANTYAQSVSSKQSPFRFWLGMPLWQFLSYFLGFWRPNLINGLSRWWQCALGWITL